MQDVSAIPRRPVLLYFLLITKSLSIEYGIMLVGKHCDNFNINSNFSIPLTNLHENVISTVFLNGNIVE